jgi:uncharacterized membrane protein YeaQ/YmgE (transglycosylase-associated protein family)
MYPLADITLHLQPGGWIAWIVVGVLAGWGAGFVMRGAGFGIVGDLITGLIGALLGGLLFGMAVPGDAGFWGSVLIAFLGACLFIFLARVVALKRTRL